MTLSQIAKECERIEARYDELWRDRENLRRTLQTFVETVQMAQRHGSSWLGPFCDSTDDGLIKWPALCEIMEQAEKQLSPRE